MVAEWALRLLRLSKCAFGKIPRLGMMPKLAQYECVASVPVICNQRKLVILQAKVVRKDVERVVIFVGEAMLGYISGKV